MYRLTVIVLLSVVALSLALDDCEDMQLKDVVHVVNAVFGKHSELGEAYSLDSTKAIRGRVCPKGKDNGKKYYEFYLVAKHRARGQNGRKHVCRYLVKGTLDLGILHIDDDTKWNCEPEEGKVQPRSDRLFLDQL